MDITGHGFRAVEAVKGCYIIQVGILAGQRYLPIHQQSTKDTHIHTIDSPEEAQ